MEFMGRPNKYPQEFRDRAVRLVWEWREARGATSGGINPVADQLGVNHETLRNWVNQADVDAGSRPGSTSEDKARIAELGARSARTRLGGRSRSVRGGVGCSTSAPMT